MLPTDSEFSLLYCGYVGVFLYFAIRLFLTRKSLFGINLAVFGLYTAFMVYIFSDKENFRYGGSLVVLFYGGVLLLTHMAVYIIIEMINTVRKPSL